MSVGSEAVLHVQSSNEGFPDLPSVRAITRA
jgi:hypothetical protein